MPIVVESCVLKRYKSEYSSCVSKYLLSSSYVICCDCDSELLSKVKSSFKASVISLTESSSSRSILPKVTS